MPQVPGIVITTLLYMLGLFIGIFGCMACVHLAALGRKYGGHAVLDELLWWCGWGEK